jgi:hydroxyacylglutathione hydrolase|tara:strand:- start:1354 stop:2118 length:765 start_codon:yes stop_codon:yes gene_type:complete
MINIEPIKAFSDNYIWLVTTNEGSIVIDPGESQNTLDYLSNKKINLSGILITHHHFDHTGGIDDLTKNNPMEVYGPNNNITSINKKVVDGDVIEIIGLQFEVMEIPGHTLDHIAFYSFNKGNPILFCGDTLFSGGCGRVFEGTHKQMYDSLVKLKKLPKNTKIYCGHEYTKSNLEFALEVDHGNKNLKSRYNEVTRLINLGHPTLPSTLGVELHINPFLRCENKDIQENIHNKFNTNKNELEIFKAIREWKDNF